MKHLMRVAEACEYYEVSENTLTSYASYYKKRHGILPPWYIIGLKRHDVRINTIEIERLGDIEHLAWLYATDTLYWKLLDSGISQSELSRLLAEHSENYKSGASWVVWLSTVLFRLPPRLILSEGKTRIAEFVELGNNLLSL